MATLGAMRLFSVGLGQSNQSELQYLAGRAMPAIDARAENADPAPAPIIIETELDHTARVRTLLRTAGLEPAQADRWAALFKDKAGTTVLERGHELVLYRDPESGDLRGLRYDLDPRTSVVERAIGYGLVMASRQPITYVIRRVSLASAVTDSFIRSAHRHGLPDGVIEALEDAFASRRDIKTLRPGSALKVIYEEPVSRDGTHKLHDRLEAAQLDVGTTRLTAFSFRDPHGGAHLYDAAGRALGQQFLRFPVNFSYISSGFSFRRYHPILHIYRPHLGVDFAAKYGTPVKAVADGRVESDGWCGELGRCIRLNHGHGLVSVYGHLSRISEALSRGGYVHMGEVIGWVGSSGLATGPHLHFGLEREGHFVDPLRQKFAISHRISPRMRPLFTEVEARDLVALGKLPNVATHFVAAEDRKPAISEYGEMYHVTIHTRVARRHHYWRWSHHKHRTPADTVEASTGGESAM
jgi:murein DD-endopeptidase MepM/ murein hydrolase activator NlpD